MTTVEQRIAKEGIRAEYDAISLYQRMQSRTKNANTKKVLAHIIKEERDHVREFQVLLRKADQEAKGR